ncbi:hypothetical protein [Streptomyces sp. NPDC001070]
MRVSRFVAAVGVASAVLLGGATTAGAATPDVVRSHVTQVTGDHGRGYDRGHDGGRGYDRGHDGGRGHHGFYRHDRFGFFGSYLFDPFFFDPFFFGGHFR